MQTYNFYATEQNVPNIKRIEKENKDKLAFIIVGPKNSAIFISSTIWNFLTSNEKDIAMESHRYIIAPKNNCIKYSMKRKELETDQSTCDNVYFYRSTFRKENIKYVIEITNNIIKTYKEKKASKDNIKVLVFE